MMKKTFALTLYCLKFVEMNIKGPSSIISSKNIINFIPKLNKICGFDNQYVKDAQNEYIFISFATKDQLFIDKITKIISTIFSVFVHNYNTDIACFYELTGHIHKFFRPNKYLSHFIQTICNLQVNSGLTDYSVNDQEFRTCIHYNRALKNMSVGFLMHLINQGYHSLFLSNCLVTKNDFILMHEIFESINRTNIPKANRFNYLFAFKKPERKSKNTFLNIDISNIMNFEYNNKNNISLEYSQLNLKKSFKHRNNDYLNIGYIVFHDFKLIGKQTKILVDVYFGGKNSFGSSFSMFNKLSLSTMCFASVFEEPNFLCRQIVKETFFNLGRITKDADNVFRFVYTKKVINKRGNVQLGMRDEISLECVSIYTLKNKKYFLHERFFNYINDKDDCVSIDYSDSNNKNLILENNKGAQKFIDRLIIYFRFGFCQESPFFLPKKSIMDCSNFFCYFDENRNSYMISLRRINSWNFFLTITSKFEKESEYAITYFEAKGDTKMVTKDCYDTKLNFYKRFKIIKKITQKINYDVFCKLRTIIIYIETKNSQLKNSYYITIPIIDLAFIFKIEILYRIYTNEQDKLYGIDVKFHSTELLDYFSKVVYLIIFKQSPHEYYLFLEFNNLEYIVDDSRLDFFMVFTAYNSNLFVQKKLYKSNHDPNFSWYSYKNEYDIAQSVLYNNLYDDLKLNNKYILYRVLIKMALERIKKSYLSDFNSSLEYEGLAVCFLTFGNYHSDSLDLPSLMKILRYSCDQN